MGSAIEAAVAELHRLNFGDVATPVVGAEWWFQEVGYHYCSSVK